MMSKLWDDLKDNMKDWSVTAVLIAESSPFYPLISRWVLWWFVVTI